MDLVDTWHKNAEHERERARRTRELAAMGGREEHLYRRATELHEFAAASHERAAQLLLESAHRQTP
jgi:hypothetical protein